MMVNAPQAPVRERATRSSNRLTQLAQSVPPDLLRSMEQLFGMQNVLNDLMNQLSDGAQTISLELRTNVPGSASIRRRVFPMRLSSHHQDIPTENTYPLKVAHEYLGLDTSSRWQQAANMWLVSASGAAERAVIYQTPISKRLEPAALEEERIQKIKEEEEGKALEEKRKQQEEEERRKAREEAEAHERAEAEAREREEADRLRREEERQERLAQEQAERERLAAEALIESSNAPGVIAMEGVETENADSDEQNGESGENEATGQLEAAAPVERVFTVLRGSRIDITGLGIDPEFMEALPEDMREEVLYQRIRERRAAAPPDQPSTLDPSFLDALPADIRAELLEEEAEERRRQERIAQRRAAGATPQTGDMDNANFLATLDPPLRQAILLEQDEDFISQLPPHIAAEANALRERVGHRLPFITRHAPPNIFGDTRRKQPSQKRRDGIQMLEKSGLATLIRLTFLRNCPEALQDILIELCRHRQTRVEVVSLLLSLLQEGSADVAAVERSFSQLSLKVRGQESGLSPVKGKTKMDSNFISHISGENSPTLIARHCLEILNHLVKNNTSLAYYFLTEHEAPSTLKRANSKKGKGKEVATKESRYPLNALLNLLERSTILETKQSTEEFARLLADVTKPLLSLIRKPKEKEVKEGQPADAVASRSAPDESSTTAPSTSEGAAVAEVAAPESPQAGASTSAPSKPEPAQQTRSLSPPVISEHSLELLVLILVAKEVSRETFRYTLATMHHLMAVPGALDVFGRGLAREAQRYGDIAQSDLWAIAQKFEAAKEAGNLKDVDLTEYTSRGTDQTKLLKIFKAIDYLFNRAQRENTAANETDESRPLDALTIYSKLSLNPLWDNLSMCLGYLGDNPETWPLAQPLLPMIESLLVACNHINTIGPGKRPQTPEAEPIENLFFRFTEEHRKILNYLVHMQPSLMSGSFEMLAHNPKVLEFDNKRNYFNRKLHDRKGQRTPSRSIPLNIRRDMVFLDSFRSLCFRTGEEIKNARLNVRFQGEEGVDAGGLTREWYQVLARQMFDPNYALFTPVASDSATFHPNKSSYVNDEHLMFFKFVGRIIGKALYDGRLLDCHFSRAVYKHILGRPISVKDLEYYDNQYYKNLMWILENPINDIVTETLSIEAEEYGVTHIIDLIPNGRTIPVTDENKSEYVRLVSEYRLQTSVKDQLKEFLAGAISQVTAFANFQASMTLSLPILFPFSRNRSSSCSFPVFLILILKIGKLIQRMFLSNCQKLTRQISELRRNISPNPVVLACGSLVQQGRAS
jgi:E3 ubiquitin-protein ligase HUWE1